MRIRGLATEDGELDIYALIDHVGLAGEAIAASQKAFCGGQGAEGFGAALDLYDALMAFAGASAGSGHANTEVVGVVEDRPAGNYVERLP